MIRILYALLAATLFLLALSGCKNIKTEGGVDAPSTYRRVVSLSPSSSEITSLITYMEVIGKTASCNFPPGLRGSVVMKGTKPDYESILKQRPDVVLYDRDVISDEDVQKFKDSGIPVHATDGGTTLAGFEKSLRELGKHSHGEYVLSSYIDQIYRQIGQAKSSAISPAPRVVVLLPGKGSEHMIAGEESTPAMIVNNSGGQFVGAPGRAFVPLNAEAFMKMNPDVIVVAGDPASVKADPRFKSMTAFQKGRIAPLLPDVILRKGSRLNTAIKNMATTILEQMRK